MKGCLVRWMTVATVVLLMSSPSLALGAGTGVVAPGARYFDAGRALVDAGHPQEGFRMLAVSVALAPDDVMRQAYLLTLLDRNAFNWDVKLHEALVTIAPAYPPLLQRLGKLYEGKQRQADAEALYLKWARLRPNQAEPWARLGEHYYFTGQYEKGLAAFSHHRELVGESDYALRRMAAIYDALGDHESARRALAGDPPALGDNTVAIARVQPFAR